jgi:nucleotide sugar dehydrogenase
MAKQRISIIGLGKLGSPMLASFAAKGHKVIGVDINSNFVQALNKGKAPVFEPQLAEYISANKERISATQDYEKAILNSDITFIVVPTPSEEHGGFSNKYVIEAGKSIGEVLKKKSSFHLVVLTSTVVPGSTEGELLPVLEKYSEKKCGVDFGLCYNPEFIALGNVIQDFLNPDFVLIGESDPHSGEILESLYKEVCENNPPVKRMSIINAELTKIALNTYVTTKISYANMLAEICEKLPGGNIDVVTSALGLDRRIGSKYLKGALGFGGPCLLPSALVQTIEGLKRIDSIKIGDLVLSHDGRYHRVTKIFQRNFNGKLIKITPEGFPKSPLLVTPEHPIWSAKRKSKLKKRYYNGATTGKIRLNYMTGHSKIDFIPAFQLEPGDLLAMPTVNLSPKEKKKFVVNLKTHHLSPVRAKIPFTPELMRMFGFYLSEGSTWKKEIKFTLNTKEECYLKEIEKTLQENFGIKTKIKERTENCIKSRISCSSLAEYFRQTFGCRARKKKIPYDWLALPKEYLIELARGLWYGDGSRSGNVFTFGTTSRELFNFMKLLMLKFQVAFSTKEYKAHIDKNGVRHQKTYHLRICNPPYIKKMNLILPDLKINPRGKGKKTIWFEDKQMLYHIKNIEKIPYQGKVFNLEVEDSNSYMLESGVVHNCFPRDNRALIYTAKKFGLTLPIAEATDKINKNQVPRLEKLILSFLPQNGKVGILGLSYKPDTNVIEESQSIEIAKVLSEKGIPLMVYDPVAMENAKKILGNNVIYASSSKECIQNSDVIVIATPWKEFQNIKSAWLKRKNGQPILIDCWRMLEPKKYKEVAQYLAIGINL